MKSVRNLLSELLVATENLAVLGVGSSLMSDDAAGVMVTDSLIKTFGEKSEHFALFSGGNAPECFTGVIKCFRPDHLILIDAADTSLAPGELCKIDPSIVSGVSFSTHMLPLKVMLDYLHKKIGCRTTILGIQPASLEFDGEMTKEVRETVDKLIEVFSKVLLNL